MRAMNDHSPAPDDSSAPAAERKFHLWRLLGVIALVIVALGVVSFLVDWFVIGPLRGRVY